MALLTTLLQLSGLLGFTWWLLGQYKDAHVTLAVHGAVFISWALGFLGLVLLPVDLAENGLEATTAVVASVGNASASTNESIALLLAGAPSKEHPRYLWAWKLLYWLTFALSWIILPFLTEFCQNGEFLLGRRVRSSLKRLLLDWTLLAAVCGAAVAYLVLVGHFSLFGLIGLAMASANTYGLLWLIALLGFGLVDIPRSFWTLRLPENCLKELHFRAVQVHEERMEAMINHEDAVGAVHDCFERMLHAEGISIILTSDMQFIKTFSLYIVWGELTMGVLRNSTSIYRTLPREWGANASELLAFAVLLYMAMCAYAGLGKLRGVGRFALRSRHGSTDLCLLKTATYQCRLQFALGYNFLLLLGDHALTDRTALATLFENMRVVHVLGRGFSVYAPTLMVLLVGFAMSDSYARVMKRLGIEQYEQVRFGNADHEALIAKGEALVQEGLETYRALIRRRKSSAATGRSGDYYRFAMSTSDGAQALLNEDGSDEESIRIHVGGGGGDIV